MKLPTINKRLLPFKIHYFFKNGGGAFLSFLAPIAYQRGISAKGVGLIWTINPFLSSFCNILLGSLADAFKLHRALLAFTCAILATSYTSFFFLPSVPNVPSPSIETSLVAQNISNETTFTLCLNTTSDITFTELVFSCGSAQSYHDVELEKTWALKCSSETVGQEQKLFMVTGIMKNNTESYEISGNQFERCFDAKQEIVNGLSQAEKITLGTRLPVICEAACDNDQISKISLLSMLGSVEFWMNAMSVIFIYISIDCSSSLADTMCFVVLGNDRHKYGKTRLFGALGWGILGPIMGALVNAFSKNKAEPDYTPAMVITATFLFFNFIYTTRINVEVPEKKSAGGVSGVIFSVPCMFLLTTTLITGIAMGLIWTFGFIYMKTVSLEWDPNFSDTNLLQGLCVGMDCFFGEVPYMFFSGYIIKKLSNVHTFSLTLTAMSIRLLFTSIIRNPWVFLVAHALHGLSFGVFIANMVSYANLLAPKGSQATMTSTAMAFLTLGKAIGAMGSGILLERYGGARTFLIIGLIVSSYTTVYVIINCFTQRRRKLPVQGIPADDKRGEYLPPVDQDQSDVIENPKEKTQQTGNIS